MSGIRTKRFGRDITTGALLESDMLAKNGITKKHIAGEIVYTEPLFDYNPTLKPFLNDDYGAAMNQNVAFGGTPELIFDGGSGGSEWTGSGDSEWDFADGGKVVLDHGANNSQALFSDAGTIDSSAYTVLTGKVDLDNYTPGTQDILFQFQFNGTPLGDSVSMNSFIDTGNFAEQDFAIPLTSFNLAGETVDEFTMTVQRSGGHQPHISFDDFTIQETGTPLVYTVRVPEAEVYMINQINFLFVDDVTSIIPVVGTTENATGVGLSYNKLLGIPELTNGIVFTRFQNNKKVINLNLKSLCDFLAFSVILDHVSDGVNTLLTLSVVLDEPILLDGKSNDELSLTISDDLSNLLKFTALTRGSIRSDPTDIDYLEKHGF